MKLHAWTCPLCRRVTLIQDDGSLRPVCLHCHRATEKSAVVFLAEVTHNPKETA